MSISMLQVLTVNKRLLSAAQHTDDSSTTPSRLSLHSIQGSPPGQTTVPLAVVDITNPLCKWFDIALASYLRCEWLVKEPVVLVGNILEADRTLRASVSDTSPQHLQSHMLSLLMYFVESCYQPDGQTSDRGITPLRTQNSARFSRVTHRLASLQLTLSR